VTHPASCADGSATLEVQLDTSVHELTVTGNLAVASSGTMTTMGAVTNQRVR